MKKLMIVGATILASFTAQAASEILHKQDQFTLAQFYDEFTEQVTSCQLTIGRYAKNKPRLIFFSKPTVELNSVDVLSTVGNFDGSGYQFKIDKGAMVQTGRTHAGGEVTYGKVDTATLDEFANGSKLLLRVHPENQFIDSQTATYSLKGSAVAINKFKVCLTGAL